MEGLETYLDIKGILEDVNTLEDSDTPGGEFLENLPDGTSLKKFHFKGSPYIGCIEYIDWEGKENEFDICVVTHFDSIDQKRDFAKNILTEIASEYEKHGIRINFRQYDQGQYLNHINKREPKLLKGN